jgi:phosphatidate cytidylyltransferase
MFSPRVITAALLAPLFLAAVYLLDTPWFSLLMAALMGPAAWEWSRLAGIQGRLSRLLYLWLLLCLFLLGYLYKDNSSANIVWSHVVVMAASVGWMLVLVEVVAIEHHLIAIPTSRLLKMVEGALVLAPAWLSLVLLHGAGMRSRLIVVLLLLLVWTADIAAFFTGRRWGRAKLSPLISPGKTWVGLYGALIATQVVALGWALFDNIQGIDMLLFLILCLIAVLASVLGDLQVSLLKRSMHTKDSGNLLPGHGGVLDRIDSLTAAAPVFVTGLLLWSAH